MWCTASCGRLVKETDTLILGSALTPYGPSNHSRCENLVCIDRIKSLVISIFICLDLLLLLGLLDVDVEVLFGDVVARDHRGVLKAVLAILRHRLPHLSVSWRIGHGLIPDHR